MQVEIKVQEDENFRLITEQSEDIVDDSNTSSATPEQVAEQPAHQEQPKRREATLENPKGHEWFNGTSWGLK